MAYMNVHVSKSLKEELAWATDKRLQVISSIMLVKTVILLRNLRIKSFKTYLILYALLCGP